VGALPFSHPLQQFEPDADNPVLKRQAGVRSGLLSVPIREGDLEMPIMRALVLTSTMLLTAVSGALAGKPAAPAKKTANSVVTCPIMKVKTAKSKAIKVKAANGKSTYVCCKACIAPAKKLLMTKKAANGTITCPIMHKKVARSQAIKVMAANGKSTYVCCQGCAEPAKKQLMAKK
jgi:hypothetical protein